MAVSGGADSRMLFATIQAHSIVKEFSVHSRCHPQLDPAEDADVLVAKMAAASIGRPHQVQRSQGIPSAYLSQELPAQPPILSGLYGGELLGGEILKLMSPESTQPLDELAFAKNITDCAQMFLCDFYGGAWNLCSTHHNLTITPYWDSYFISALLQTPTSIIQDYSLVSKMYQSLPLNLRSLPFVSILADYHPQWKKPLPGRNPKSLYGVAAPRKYPVTWFKFKTSASEAAFRKSRSFVALSICHLQCV